MSPNIKIKKIFLSSFAAVLGSSILAMATQQPAEAAGGNSFRSFREQNVGLDRHTARRMFQLERRANRNVVNILPVNTINDTTHNLDVVGVCGTGLPTINKQEIKPREIRQSIQVLNTGRSVRLNSGVNLDLNSTERNITLGEKLFSAVGSVEITSGGVNKTVEAGSQVSAAEYIAVKQVLAGTGQKVSIDKSGRATGGEVDLGSITTDSILRANSFVNAEKVTTYGDFGRHSDFRLNGDLSNYGTVNALSSDANVRQGAIRAVDITNHEGAFINSSVDLTLDASGVLANKGSINSTGSVTLTAGSSIVNSGAVKASSNVSLNAANVNNQGTIASEHGDINLNGAADTTLTVNNAGGTLSAVNGAINVRDYSYAGACDTSILGGDLLSTALNLNSGTGLTSVDVGQLTGVINQSGTAAHVKASTDVLNIGQVCLTGDPTFYNTAGDININADITVGEVLTIVAAGNIHGAADVDVIAGDANRGYDITMIAGAAFTATGGANSPTLPPLTGAGAVTLSGKASKTGGSIIFDNNTRIAARSTDATGNDPGGDVSMFAFAGKNAGSGVVDLAGCNVVTGGKNAGANGQVLILAGAAGKSSAPVDAIITGVIDTAGGTGAVADVFAITAQPVSSGPVTYGADGELTSPFALGFSGKLTKGSDIRIQNVSGGLEHKVSGKSVIGAGNEIYVQGDVFVTGLIDWLGIGSIESGAAPLPIESATKIRLNSNGNIGTDGEALLVKAPQVQANTSGDTVNLAVAGNGTTDILSSSAGSKLTIESETGTLTATTGAITAPTVVLAAANFGTIGSIVASTEVALSKIGAGTLNSAGFTSIKTPKLTLLSTTADIGSAATHFLLPDSVEVLNAVSNSGNIFVTSDSGQDLTVGSVTGASVDLDTAAGLTIVNAILGSASTVDVQAGGGTLELQAGAAVSGKTSVSLKNVGLTKSKLVIGANVNILTSADVAGQGDVFISLGATGPVTSPTPANLNVTSGGGSAFFTGSQKAVDGGLLKAKTPVNNLILDGANININNGTDKAGNFTMGGNVNVTAD
ncbi:MAG: hypothetical protein K2X93_15100 [Candidatus Obscuribacterales bacterium]|nr:hypothetical protein [Candidatus Obscuribacterales bacterium]